MKTKEELENIKQELNAVRQKLAELSEDELKEVTGGSGHLQPRVVTSCTIWETCPHADPSECGLHLDTNPNANFICPKI